MAARSGIFGGLDTVLLRVRNIEISKRWYEEKLGFADPYYDPSERLAVFDLGGTTSLTLWELKEGESLPPSNMARPFPIFSVSDALHVKSLLRERGVAVGEILQGGGVTYFTFRDLDDNLLEACQVH